MAAITLEQAKNMLTLWMDAEASVASGQSYSIDVGGTRRSLNRADAGEITNKINYWSKMVERLESGSTAPRVRLIVPRD